MEPVAVTGVGMTPFGRYLDRSLKDLGREAIEAAMADAGVGVADIQGVFFANALAGLITGQECIRGETVVHPMGIGTVPVHNIENACASAGNALHLAWLAVASGAYDCVLAVGVEKLVHEDKARTFTAYKAGMDIDQQGSFADAGEDRSPFVDRYARMWADFQARGVTLEALARLASKAHTNGSKNPMAFKRRALTPEEVLAARVVVEPLTVPMMSPINDGAAAAIVRRATGAPGEVKILGSALRTLAAVAGQGPSSFSAAANAAYEMAGVGPGEIDFAEVHDASAIGEMVSWVQTGLCPAGQEQEWAMSGHTEVGGPLPVNPSGGLMSRGHPVGATGLAQIYEAVQQFRGLCGERQVASPRRALCSVGGGLIGTSTAASAAHVLGV